MERATGRVQYRRPELSTPGAGAIPILGRALSG